ncbi:hypothetical protein PC9H_007599 [Pleurotus ostreatus]|uniref:Asparaginase n=1 Tax=Pleurotus ostreatus TaxID=5322 RepID=A0A8H6ZTW0_PLEOS|nr:uncharacterized protein PC9H_007599 [Pleurotus ostreatus]KAF7428376.1 hypothetical protein PC9H_007599 [Pleurotus ostreatus]
MLPEKIGLIQKPPKGKSRYVLVIHGGAGTMTRAGSTPEQQAAYKSALSKALQTGYAVLKEGGEAMDAAVAAVSSMEDCPLFNSGKGAVFNVAGKNELESSIMLSKPPVSHPDVPATRRGIGLTLLTHVKNPSRLARALYLSEDLAPHTLLSGSSAEQSAKVLGEELVDPSYFFTEKRWREHRRGLGLPEDPLPPIHSEPAPGEDIPIPLDQMPTGTVGAVALDIRGCIAAVTSTGGKTNKLEGRIGDTPQMGSGFWAEEWKKPGSFARALDTLIRRRRVNAVGISGTGDGDYFIRRATASTIARRIRYRHESLHKATHRVVEDLRKDGGIGGVIALDNAGNGNTPALIKTRAAADHHISEVAMPLNCEGMYRGVIKEDGVPNTAIFDDDVLS